MDKEKELKKEVGEDIRAAEDEIKYQIDKIKLIIMGYAMERIKSNKNKKE